MSKIIQTEKGWKINLNEIEGTISEIKTFVLDIQVQLEYLEENGRLREEGKVRLFKNKEIAEDLYDATIEILYTVPYTWLEQIKEEEKVETTVAEFAYNKKGDQQLFERAERENVILS